MSTSGEPGDDGTHPPEAAIAVDTFVSEERGRWFVDIVVVFADGAVRRRVNDYPSRRRAEIAADWIKRTADRDVDGPWQG